MKWRNGVFKYHFLLIVASVDLPINRHKIVPFSAPPSHVFPPSSENDSAMTPSAPRFQPFSAPATRISFHSLAPKGLHIFDRLKTLLPKSCQCCDIAPMAQRTLLQLASQENNHLAKRFDFPRLSLTSVPQRAQVFLVQTDGRNGHRGRERSGRWFWRGRFGFR